MAGRPRNPIRPKTLTGRIGERIEAIRKARGMTSGELAEASGVGIATVIRIEAGIGRPQYETLISICRALKIKPTELPS